MASYIKILKEDNDDIIYPQTKGSAVLLDGGSDLESVLAAKADASTVNQKITVGDVQSTDIVANAVTTAKIADSNVTAAKLASNSVITAKIADGAVTSAKIDWTTIIGTISDVAFGNGYIDLGTIRIQWMNRQKTGLNTAAGGYNTWTVDWPVAFGSANYAVVCSPIGDTGNIAGGEFKVYYKSTTTVGFNYNHTGSIGTSTLNYSAIAIGVKPS